MHNIYIPVEEVTRIDKNDEETTKDIYCILEFIDRAKVMTSSLSNLVNIISEGLHRIKRKLGHNNKKYETCGIKYKYCDCFLEYKIFKNDLIEYRCLVWKKNCQPKFYEKLKEIFYKYIHTNFLAMITIILFYFYGKMFISMNLWMIRKNSMKTSYQKNKTFIDT